MLVEHVAINVKDPGAMAKWYCENLGMKIVRDTGTAYFIADESGHGVLEIYNNPPDQVPDYSSMDPLLFHIAFQSTDIRKDHERLVAAGAAPEGECPAEGDEYGLFILRDPWGLAIQLAKREKGLLA